MTTTEQDLDAFRLQDCVWPRRYTLRLAPDLATASFEGEELTGAARLGLPLGGEIDVGPAGEEIEFVPR